MKNDDFLSEGGALHKCALDIDRVVNALEYAEADLDVCYKAAALIQVCINQLKKTFQLLTMNSVMTGRRINNEKRNHW